MAIGDVDGAFAKADRVVRATVFVHRHQPVPMECRGLVASWDAANEHLTIHSSTQSPHMLRLLLPPQIGVPMEKIRVLAADVGGGFGLKNGVSREDVAVVAASIDLGRPVKWIEDRLEHLATGGQAREEMADLEAAVTADGVLLGVRMEVKLNAGAYPCDPFPGAMFVGSISGGFQGPTRIEGISATTSGGVQQQGHLCLLPGTLGDGGLHARALARHRRPRARHRPASRCGGATTCERGQPPLAMLTGQPFESATTREQVEQAAKIVDWDGFRRRQAELRAEGRYVGIGMASYLEAAPGPKIPGPATRRRASSATR